MLWFLNIFSPKKYCRKIVPFPPKYCYFMQEIDH
jgi:hypothetical protein